MATAHIGDIEVGRSWLNLVTVEAGAASVDLILQNQGPQTVFIISGGTEPTTDNGIVLKALDSVKLNAAAIWAKGNGITTVSLMTV
jgi:hypothetical protein